MTSRSLRIPLGALIATLLVAAACYSAGQRDAMNPMEQKQAIALLRNAYASFNRGDIHGAVAGLDPNIDWREPVEFPGGGSYHGRAAVAGYLANSRANWAEGASQPRKFIVHGNRVVVFVHAHFRVKGAKTWNDVHLADVYTFRGGVPVAMQAFADREMAVRWVKAETGS
jgi:ketosteroid isomerase-like protein